MPPHVSMGFDQAWIFLTDVLPARSPDLRDLNPDCDDTVSADNDFETADPPPPSCID